jgi:hypothetical protein
MEFLSNLLIRINKKTENFMINDIRTLIDKLERIEEGEIGAKIGGALGGLIGQQDAGAKIGSDIGDFFSPTSKGHSSGPITRNPSSASNPAGTSSSSGYQALGPDGKTMVGVIDAPDGTRVGQDHADKPRTNPNGGRTDKFGVSDGEYIEQSTISVNGKIGLTSGGSFADEIQKLESGRGTGLKLNQSWGFKNSTLAVLEGERADGGRIWKNLASLGSFDMGDEVAQFYQKYGYKLTSDKDSVTPSKLGTFRTEEQQLTKGFKNIIVRNSFMLFAFESPKGKGLHIIQVSFIGPATDYQSGGLQALNSLINNLEPASNIKPLTVNR